MTTLNRTTAMDFLQQHRTRLGDKVSDAQVTDVFLDHRLLTHARDFELLIRWMCQRSAYIVLAESVLLADLPPEGYLRQAFGWVECVAASEVRYGTAGQCTTCYFLPCHEGQVEPLLSMMNGLQSYGCGCPVDDLAFIDAEGLPRLVTVTHEEIAWLHIPPSELQEAEVTGQSWLNALS